MAGNITSLNDRLYSTNLSQSNGDGAANKSSRAGSGTSAKEEDKVTLSREARKLGTEYASDKQNIESSYARKKRNLQTQYNRELQALEAEYRQDKLVAEIA